MGKYFTTADYNKFTSNILDVKLKQKELVNKSGIDKKLININKKITSNKTKHVEAEKKITNLTNKVAQWINLMVLFFQMIFWLISS